MASGRLGEVGLVTILNPYLWIGIVLACLLSFFGGCAQGKKGVQADWDASVERGRAEVARLTSEAGKVTVKVETKTVEKIVTVREKARAIETVREVFVPVDSGNLLGGFRLFHDAAVEGAIPDAAGLADAAPVPVTDVAATVASNYEKCHIAYETVAGWQSWAAEQAAVH
jgi:hypothetical protein